ncbi:hypothetical protein N7457_002485 [Penicillium paradoxum]|uniref:uncharacterized protein n=1 Tax=Penicillium paradoxum TaxID=176176 RepID=UPI002546FAD1|nr:uncharacterized protein N7457_002485 [Penicillium paradoxum]KAJ5787495.1 hypothetical protein N7457_002485 [Penicillium paradoxum]
MRTQGKATRSLAGGSDHVCFGDEDASCLIDQEHAASPQESTARNQEAEPGFHRRREPYRSFNVFKDVALGTNAFSFCLQVHPSGGLAQSPSPVYHTLRIPWYRQGLYLPASFDLYSGGNIVRSRKDPSPAPQDHRAYIHYRGFQGLLGLHVTVDMFCQAQSTALHMGNPSSGQKSADLVKHCSIEIFRKGIGRTYRVEIIQAGTVKTFYWKGSKSALSLLETEGTDTRSSSGNGNLKFFAAETPDDILAVWQNKTDQRILGCLNVIAQLDANSDGILEGVIVTSLAVVVAERVSGRGWVGGLGKSTKSQVT